jgi:hypothetical protein
MELASTCRRAHTGLEGTANSVAIAGRDRWFESDSLQRRVTNEPGSPILRPTENGSSDGQLPGFQPSTAVGEELLGALDLAVEAPPRRRCRAGRSGVRSKLGFEGVEPAETGRSSQSMKWVLRSSQFGPFSSVRIGKNPH